MLVLDFPRNDRCSDTDWWPTVNGFETALKAHAAKGAIVASMGENLSEAHAEDLLRRGIVPILGIAEAMDAAESAAFVGEAWRREASLPGMPAIGPVKEQMDAKPEWECCPDRRSGRQGNARRSRPPRSAWPPRDERRRGGPGGEAIGYPVALKALGLAHKSEAGAVKLDLCDADAVRAAASALLPLGTGLYVERNGRCVSRS